MNRKSFGLSLLVVNFDCVVHQLSFLFLFPTYLGILDADCELVEEYLYQSTCKNYKGNSQWQTMQPLATLIFQSDLTNQY